MKRVLSIQDISCIGKCSQTVALPVISAMGIETAILPTAVLSAHTAFDGFTFKDLTDVTDMIYIWYRDVLVYKTTGNESLVMEKDMLGVVKAEAERVSFDGLYAVDGLINETKRQIRQNVNFVFAMEMLFINIKGELSK